MLRKLSALLEDFSTAPVPDAHVVGGARVALIIIGIGIALPGFLMGAQLGTALGLEQAAVAFAIGGLILAVVASVTALVGADARLSTYMIVQFAFGTSGARLVNTVLAATMVGWFGVNAALFGDAMVATIGQMYHTTGGWSSYVAIGSALMVLTTLFGFKALDRLSQLAVPLLLAILIAILGMSFTTSSTAQLLGAHHGNMSVGLAISAVVGGSMVGAASMPDVTRYVSSRRGAVWSMFASYAVAGPIILLSAAVPSLATGEGDLMKIFLGLGLGLTTLFVLVFSTWTSNAANLYSSGLCLAATFRSVRPWKLTLLAGIFGTVVALSGIIDVFIPFLVTLAVLMPPIAAIYVTDFYLLARRHYDLTTLADRPAVRWQAFVAWAIGSLAGLATANGLMQLTTIAACDSLLCAGFSYVLLMKLPFGLRKPLPECPESGP